MCTWLNQAPSRERRSCNPEAERSRPSAGETACNSLLSPSPGSARSNGIKDEKPTVVSAEGESPEKSGDFKGGDLMKIPSLKLVYFSPTGTTKKVVQGIARGINPGSVEELDITRPAARIPTTPDIGKRITHYRSAGVYGKGAGTCSRMAAGVTGA